MLGGGAAAGFDDARGLGLDAAGSALAAADGTALGPGAADSAGTAEPLGAGVGATNPEGMGPGLPCASLSWARITAGTFGALGLAARHQISDQLEPPRVLHFFEKPKAANDSGQCS